MITIRDHLIETSAHPPFGDHELEKRLFFADKIRQQASTANLGPSFIDFQFNAPNINVRGPQSVDFIFGETDGATREEQTQRLRRLVVDFMKGLRAA